jgi:hypothetical protein
LEAPPREPPPKPFGPHSGALKNGSTMDSFIDPDSREGRFMDAIEAGLIEQLGRSPTFSERLVIRRAEFVIVGWSDPERTRPHLGALLLGYYTDDGKLIYAGH